MKSYWLKVLTRMLSQQLGWDKLEDSSAGLACITLPGWPHSRDWQLMLAVSKAPQACSMWSLTLPWARLGISMASWPCSKRVTPEAAMPLEA